MDTKQARQVLTSLVEGVDPTSGAEFQGHPILQNAKVLRALLAGISALDVKAARDARRSALPENVGTRWTDEEERALTDAFRAGDTLQEIAGRVGRSVRAIEARLIKVGLMSPQDRTTTDPFIPALQSA